MIILFIVDSYGKYSLISSLVIPMLCLSASFAKMVYSALCNAFKKPGFLISGSQNGVWP